MRGLPKLKTGWKVMLGEQLDAEVKKYIQAEALEHLLAQVL